MEDSDLTALVQGTDKSIEYKLLTENKLLAAQRRYILIVRAPNLPIKSPFTWVADDGMYYYIDADDYISQKNFRFLSLITTIEAVAPPQPLTPTITVGGQ